ncbi:MAG: HEAT repeat domain-containing protein [Candidatus Omnitrophica bacterium]|nr:HEAT repeat domain-containing protein [Candidatus Omnitrophota bacterium]
MKIIQRVTMLHAVLIAITVLPLSLRAQPFLPKEKIPFTLSPDIKEQIEKLYSVNPQERADAVVRLGEMGNKASEAVPYVSDLLGDMGRLKPYGFVGTKASEALIKIGPSAVESLIGVLKTSRERSARINAVLALGQIKDVRAIEPLITIFKEEDTLFRLYAAEAIGQIGTPAIDALQGIVQDKDTGVREAAVVGLGRIAMYKRDKSAVDFLVAALTDGDVAVRRQAVLALFNISNWYKEIFAVDALIAVLSDSDSEVAGYAAWALGNIADTRAIQPLILALKYKSQPYAQKIYGMDVHKNIVEALAKFGKVATDYLLNALEDTDAGIRGGAAETLGLIKEVRATERLIALLSDQQENVRHAAAGALKTIGEPVIWPLITALRGADREAQPLMAQTLGALTGEKFGTDEVKWHEWWEKKNKALTR